MFRQNFCQLVKNVLCIKLIIIKIAGRSEGFKISPFINSQIHVAKFSAASRPNKRFSNVTTRIFDHQQTRR